MLPLNIIVLNRLAERHLAAIESAAPGSRVVTCTLEEADAYAANADILVAWGHLDIRSFYRGAPRLQWIHSLSAGVEKLLLPELLAKNTLLTNSRGIHGIPISEHVLALILAFTRGLPDFYRQQRQKAWRRAPLEEVYEKTIGIVGLGSIGREIAKRAKGLGMQVLATKRLLTNELFVDQLYAPDQLTELLTAADFVVVTLPLTPETEGLFNSNLFAKMKSSAYFINMARGAITNEADLITALREKRIRGAALDVFETEPLPADSPLWEMDNVIITPHIAGLSPYYLDRAVKLLAENLARFANGDELFNVVDHEKGY